MLGAVTDSESEQDRCRDLGITSLSQIVGDGGGEIILFEDLEKVLNDFSKRRSDYNLIHIFGNPGTITTGYHYLGKKKPFQRLNLRLTDNESEKVRIDYNNNFGEKTVEGPILIRPEFRVRTLKVPPWEYHGETIDKFHQTITSSTLLRHFQIDFEGFAWSAYRAVTGFKINY